MSNEQMVSAGEKEAALYDRLDELTEEWALAERELRAAEIENRLQQIERDEDHAERIDALTEELSFLRAVLPVNPNEVLKGGKVVADIPWRNGESVSNVYIWSLCTKSWVFLTASHYENGRVCGAIGSTVTKCYGGVFQLMRYKGKLFWIRKRPMTYVRKRGPGGYIMGTLGENCIRKGRSGGVIASVHGKYIRIGFEGHIIAAVDGKLIRKGKAGVIMGSIDGNSIRSGASGGVVKYTVDGRANNNEKGGLAASAMVIDGELG